MSTLAVITPVDPSGNPVDPGYGQGHPGGRPTHPIALPPLPPGQKPDNTLPSGPVYPTHGPIFINGTPEHPIALPPAQVWPPLNPGDGIYGKSLVLVWVVGTDKYRWVSLEPPTMWPPPPPTGEPKRA
jgi:hypothetical protein